MKTTLTGANTVNETQAAMKKVKFRQMSEGTRADYDLVEEYDDRNASELPDRLLQWLGSMNGPSAYMVTRLEHSLQTATRAERDGADEETIVCALLHDIGDVLAPTNHSQVAAAILRPYVSEQNWWVVEHHGLFQGYYYFHHYGQERNERDRYKDHPYYSACVDFCERWDQASFDPDYPTEPLEHFEPMLRSVFGQPPKPFV